MNDEIDDKSAESTGARSAAPADAPIDPAAEGADAEIEIVDDDGGAKVAALEKKLAEEHDRHLRAAADLDNFRKRARRDVDDAASRGRAEILNELLPAIDALDLALKNANEATPARALIDGVEMVRRQFLTSMKRFGLQPIDAVGASFDPNFHEAVSHIPSALVPAHGVIDELRRGYMLGERLLRATLVVVSSGPPAATEPSAEGGSGEERGDG